MQEKRNERKRLRLTDYDYSSNGAYFITICTKDKKCILSKIVGDDALIVPQVNLLPYGEIIKKHIENIRGIDRYIIMPNHIHFIMFIDGTMGASSPTNVPNEIRLFKRFVTAEIGEPIFQRSYYDHIIRDEEDYIRCSEYVINNPSKWNKDKYYE